MIRRVDLTALLFAAMMCGGCDPEPTQPATPVSPCDKFIDDAPETSPTSAFSIVVLPDTQFYSERHPETFQSQVAWIEDNEDARNIAFVLHEGDIVNHNVAEQWDVASQALHSLDGVVPYVLAVGNHDLRGSVTGLSREVDFFDENFPVAMHDDDAWFCGSYDESDLQNSYALLEGGGRKWLVLALEFGPRDEVLLWANDILSDYAQYPAIIVTHAYMYLGDDRYDHVGMPLQEFSPYSYGIVGSINDGEEMWNALVAPNANVKFVFSGHMLFPGVGRLTSVRADGSTTHQVLANYQTCATADPCVNPMTGEMNRGGDGYLRIVDISTDHTRADITTYSTTLDNYKRDIDNEFSLELSTN